MLFSELLYKHREKCYTKTNTDMKGAGFYAIDYTSICI